MAVTPVASDRDARPVVDGFGFGVWVLGFRVFGFVSSFGFRVSNFGFLVHGSWFQMMNFGMRDKV